MTTQVDFLAPMLAPRTLRGDPLPKRLWRVTHRSTQSIIDLDTGDMLAAKRDEFNDLDDFRDDIVRHVNWENRIPTRFISVWGTYPRAHNWIQMECIWAPAEMWEIDVEIALEEGARIMQVELLMARLDFYHPQIPNTRMLTPPSTPHRVLVEQSRQDVGSDQEDSPQTSHDESQAWSEVETREETEQPVSEVGSGHNSDEEESDGEEEAATQEAKSEASTEAGRENWQSGREEEEEGVESIESQLVNLTI
ncbi:uncharacterized protein CTHT_0019600 [Thermochaetoides thermophila DSM 1495]|uniref:Uncharacterized protein n=1 Tax=Chaetomium thermophilum (strain DSM 1495 / CBS 144.50 / IMI 039719) TaxID=759272 RepID=G0S344_CHATD|nr:hypothetical protein CTHT_0019600 [Thermochaetoides thermophila DSM 1495]EGS22427.1 hypothetical protein CTHT_0019600 [Thermochaetoides thermophila DSM 1495]